MSDEEILTTFMDPHCESGDWWVSVQMGRVVEFQPTPIDLDKCHLIETRLTDEQWERYGAALLLAVNRSGKGMIHTTAPTKIKCLASVLRQEVKG